MPADVWYGAQCETRIGRRTNLETAPTAWQGVTYMSATFSPSQEWRDRPLLGSPGMRKNVLDPTRPRKGFFRLGAEVVLDADARSLPLWLRYSMGAPFTFAGGAPFYSHSFDSGSRIEQYFDMAVKVGDADIRVYEGLTLGQISTQFAGETTQDFNINLSLRGLRRRRLSTWPTGTVTAAPAESPILRALFQIDDVAADNMLSGSFSYDRQIQEGIFLSPTPTVSSNRPNGGAHSGSATYRAIGSVFDGMEEADTSFAAIFRMMGVEAGHYIDLKHPQALLAPSPLPINGLGMIERSLNWAPYQTASSPAATIVIGNTIAGYP